MWINPPVDIAVSQPRKIFVSRNTHPWVSESATVLASASLGVSSTAPRAPKTPSLAFLISSSFMTPFARTTNEFMSVLLWEKQYEADVLKKPNKKSPACAPKVDWGIVTSKALTRAGRVNPVLSVYSVGYSSRKVRVSSLIVFLQARSVFATSQFLYDKVSVWRE